MTVERGPRVPSRRWLHLAPVTIVASLAIVAHLPALDDGLFLDDRLHQQRLAAARWCLTDLLAATTIEPATFIEAWWQDRPVVWDYARPLAMAFMKLSHDLSGGNVRTQHAVGLAWHALAAVMVYLLAHRLTARRGWAMVAGGVFTVYPHAVFTVGWLAAHNVIMQTVWSIAAVWCTLRSGGHPHNQPLSRSGRRGWAFAALVCVVAALGCRENAAVLGVMLPAVELAFGGVKGLRRRWVFHVTVAVLIATFVGWRLFAYGHAVPDGYVQRFDGLGFLAWLGVKLLHYVTSVIWVNPLFGGPARDAIPLRDAPLDTLLMLGIIGGLAVGYYRATRNTVRGAWLWPLWIVLSILPVVNVVATPHSAYMGGAGFVIACVLRPATVSPAAARGSVMWLSYVLAISIFATAVYRPCWRGVVRAEQAIHRQMERVPEPEGATDVYFINLPLASIYLPLTMAQAWPRRAHRGHVLTFAPHLLVPPCGGRIVQVDDHRFDLILDDHRYFSGMLGRFLVEAYRGAGARLGPGARVDGVGCTVEVLAADDRGVRQLRFDFNRPLSSPESAFYVVEASCAIARVRFPEGGGPGPAERSWAMPPPGTEELSSVRRLFSIVRFAARLLPSDLYLTRDPDHAAPVVPEPGFDRSPQMPMITPHSGGLRNDDE